MSTEFHNINAIQNGHAAEDNFLLTSFVQVQNGDSLSKHTKIATLFQCFHQCINFTANSNNPLSNQKNS